MALTDGPRARARSGGRTRRAKTRMTFEYTGRHVEVTPAIRRHVEEQFRKLAHIFNGNNVPVHVILAVEKNRQTGELVVHWLDHTLTASDTNADMYMALTRAVGKRETQAQKKKNRISDHNHDARNPPVDAPLLDGQTNPAPLAVRNSTPRRYSVKPM